MAFDNKTVLSAHNSHLEKNYRTTASQRRPNGSLGGDNYLIEDGDVANTLYAHFNREMDRINCPISTISDIANNAAPRKDLRHFYLLLPSQSHENETSVSYLDRSTTLSDGLADQTIYRFPMILVLRVGPKDLDTSKYKLVKLPTNGSFHATENAVFSHGGRDKEASGHSLGTHVEKRQASPRLAPKHTPVTKTAVAKEKRLNATLKEWIHHAEKAFSNPDPIAMEDLELSSTRLAKRAVECMHTTPTDMAIDNNASSTQRHYQQVKRLVIHLCGSAVSLQWDSEFILETYRSLKHTIGLDLVKMRNRGYGYLGNVSPEPKEPDYDRMIEIPNICVPYIQRVCGSFIPKMRQAHENSSIHEPA